MNLVLLLSVFLVSVLAFPSDEKYKSQYEDVDVDQILHSTRLLKNYVDCLLDKGRCPPPAKELRDHLEDALKTECTKCTDSQRKLADKVITFMLENHPDMFNPVQAKYDPEGIYMAKWKAYKESKANEEKSES